MWIDGSGISHVVDATAEEGLDRGSEVEGDHTSSDCAHTRCLHACCRGLVRLLGAIGNAIIVGVVAGARRDSSAETGAGSHCITWEAGIETRLCIEQGRDGEQRLFHRGCEVEKARVDMSQAMERRRLWPSQSWGMVGSTW